MVSNVNNGVFETTTALGHLTVGCLEQTRKIRGGSRSAITAGHLIIIIIIIIIIAICGCTGDVARIAETLGFYFLGQATNCHVFAMNCHVFAV